MTATGTLTNEQLATAYISACESEINAFKPGNVSVHSDGHGMTVDDFYTSAAVSASPITNPSYSLGEKIFYALKSTNAAVGCNTNLGIVLLCAPLIQSVQLDLAGTLRSRLRYVLNNTSIDDADWVFRGIKLAKPAGLGEVGHQDVAQNPDVSLRDAMRIAADCDRIAYQYVSDYEDVFEYAKNRYHTAVGQWEEETWAAVAVFVGLLAKIPDSHIERKYGDKFTRMVATRMISLDKELSHSRKPERCFSRLQKVDAEFKEAGINPGTTADLTVATLLVVRLELLLSQHNENKVEISECDAEQHL